MLKALLAIELDGTITIPMFGGCTTLEESFQEAMCQAIHEGNDNALTWLKSYVTDIPTPQIIAV